MHSVHRSEEPAEFADIRAAHTDYDDLDPSERQIIRNLLVEEFGNICCYCEQACQPYGGTPNSGEIEHFRPRSNSPLRFPELSLQWPNLMYSCHRCNWEKANQWPGCDSPSIHEALKSLYPRYRSVSTYVNPNVEPGLRNAREYFHFDIETGQVCPADCLSDEEWSIAQRTIRDINLNDFRGDLSEYDERNITYRRRFQLHLVIRIFQSSDGFEEQVKTMLEYMNPGHPYSAFVAAYFRRRFPLLSPLLPRH